MLIDQLDTFIRKYYVNQFIRGALYCIGLVVGLFVLFNVLEYYFYFSTTTRKLLFYTFLGITAASFYWWVLLPLMHYFRLGQTISHEQAARIIGDHFVSVKDKLLNILQLRKQALTVTDQSLIVASINQKSEEIRFVPFKAAINLAQNKKYLRYAMPPLALLLFLLFFDSSIITESAVRLINNSTEFERPAPFQFDIKAEKLQVIQYGDYDLTVNVSGSALPNEVYIDVDNYQYRLTKQDANTFTYKFVNVQKETPFRLFSAGVNSKNYTLNVLKKPNITDFFVRLNYPAYTQRSNESLSNIGDLSVPVGTTINWSFNTDNTDNVTIKFGENKAITANKNENAAFSFGRRAMADESYKIFISNAALPNADSVGYMITVTPDLYPTINVEKFDDSLDNKVIYFAGDATDDYGINSLSFNYRIKNNGRDGQLMTTKLPKQAGKSTTYEYTFDAAKLNLQAGDEVTYYFEVFDNDAVHGSKSARTNTMVYKQASKDELEKQAEQSDQQIKDELEKAIKEASQIQDELKKLREKMLQEKNLNWQDKKELEKLLERQQELQKKIEEARKNFEDNLKKQEEIQKPDEELQKKQEQLKDLFEKLENKELQDLLQKIQELMQQLQKDQSLEMMEKMEQQNKESEMQLDRVKEMFKQLELEAEMKKAVEKLEELAQKEDKLAQETEDKKQSQEDLKNKQEDIQKEFDKLEEQIKDIEKKNKDLERPKDLDKPSEKMDDINQDMKDSKKQLNENENNKASKSQKKAAQKMKEMANDMDMKMQSGEQEQAEEDVKALRQLLENLVTLSYDQEGLMKTLDKTEINTPRYVKVGQEQKKIKDDFQLVRDSLHELSKRVFQIQSFVTEKVAEIDANLNQSIKSIEDRTKPITADHQQRTMKNLNDLALMLSEAMNQMQQQMANQMSGSQMCQNPGGKNPSSGSGKVPMDKIGKGQEGLNQQMQNTKERMQNGNTPNSKEFAEMAAQQAALRKALRDLQKEKQEKGQGGQEFNDLINQMDKTETELVNKRLNNETLKRQQDILTRLLEAEKAERKRDLDQKREAETARTQERKRPPSLEEYLRKREAEVEQYRTVSPALKPYYKQLVEEYYNSLKGK